MPLTHDLKETIRARTESDLDLCNHAKLDNRQHTVYGTLMIRSFKHRGLKRFFERDDRSGLRPDMVNVIQEILTALDEATDPQELNLPGYRLHQLKGA